MTTIVKSDAGLDAPLEWMRSTPPPEPQLVEDPLVLELRAEIERLERALDDAARDNEVRIKKAREETKAEAQALFVADEAARTSAVENAVRSLFDQLKDALGEVEALALVMSKGALASVFEESSDLQERVARSIERQLKLVRRDGIVSISVSPADFSESALVSLNRRLDLSLVTVCADTALASGESRLSLELGDIEISLPRYWRELELALSDAAAGPRPL